MIGAQPADFIDLIAMNILLMEPPLVAPESEVVRSIAFSVVDPVLRTNRAGQAVG